MLCTPKVPPICTEGPAVAVARQQYPTWTSALRSHSPSLLPVTAFLEQGSPAGAQTGSRASPGIALEMQTRMPLPRPTESEPVRTSPPVMIPMLLEFEPSCPSPQAGGSSQGGHVSVPTPSSSCSGQPRTFVGHRRSPYFLLIGESSPWRVASEGLPTLRLHPLSFLMGCVLHILKSAPPKSSPAFFLHSFQLRKPRTRCLVSAGVCFLQGEGRFCRVLQFPSASLKLIF